MKDAHSSNYAGMNYLQSGVTKPHDKV